MVRNTYSKTKIFGGLTLVGALTLLAFNPMQPAFAESGSFSATVDEMLTVTLDTGSTSASGTPTSGGQLLRTKVGLQVSTNNATGFSASMTTSSTTTNLSNSAGSTDAYKIPVLTSNYTKSNFPANYWGYSYDDTSAGSDSSTYRPIAALGATSPSYIMNSGKSTTTVSKDIYFASKATTAKAAGSYTNSVVISVVSGVNTSAPTTPTNPVKPSDDSTPNDGNGNPGNNGGTYVSSAGSTVTRATSGTTTTTQVSSGNTTNSYSKPQGVTNTTNTTTTTATINEGTPLATGLAVTAGVAAVAGIAFFVVAKKKQDDEDEEEF